MVFLPSIKEIKEVSGLIFQDTDKSFETIEKMLPFHIEELHGGLRPSEKDQVFNPCPSLQRKVRVILATKIAETAITLEDVYYVLDSGKETEYFFDEESQMDFHKQMDISLSSAIQRKGRAGRIANGFCFKMYKQEEEMEFRLTSTPEILRMDITDILMTQIELVDFFLSSDLLYYDQIKEEKVNSLTAELKRIKALEDQNDRTVLTSKGRFMIQSGLKALTGAFLFECIRYGAKELGLIAATAIQGTRNVFRNNVRASDAGRGEEVLRNRDRPGPELPGCGADEPRRLGAADLDLQALREDRPSQEEEVPQRLLHIGEGDEEALHAERADRVVACRSPAKSTCSPTCTPPSTRQPAG